MMPNGGDTTHPPGAHRSWTKRLIGHFIEHLPAAVFVAAAVTIVRLHFHWLDGIDSYVFMAIGQMSATEAAVAEPKPRALTVLIDQETYEREYFDRSPLNRCTLRNHLQAVYDAQPKVVVIDIDISPAAWMDRKPTGSKLECEPQKSAGIQDGFECQQQLYCLIRRKAAAGIHSVLLEPFPVTSPPLQQTHAAWKLQMVAMHENAKGRVLFADGQLPISYGVVNRYLDRPSSLVPLARNPAGSLSAASRPSAWIDPRRYRDGLTLLRLTDLCRDKTCSASPDRSKPDWTTVDTARIKEELNRISRDTDDPQRIAFFGGAYGKDDLFVTPLGMAYGVEVHAAAYASKNAVEEHHFRDFLLDIVLALLVSVPIVACWSAYFRLRVDPPQQWAWAVPFAGVLIVALLLVVLLTVVLVSWLSLELLTASAIWLSPVPIAIGMMIEGFSAGSVRQAVHMLQHQRPRQDRGHSLWFFGMHIATAANGTTREELRLLWSRSEESPWRKLPLVWMTLWIVTVSTALALIFTAH